MEVTEKIRIAETNLNRAIEWHGRYNNRVAVLIALNTGMLGVITVAIKYIASFDVLTVSLYATFLLLGLSFLMILVGEYPHTKGPVNSLIYFGSVGHKIQSKFELEYESMSDDAYLNDLLEQYWIVSKLLVSKFKYLSISLILTLLAIIPWSIALLLA